MKEDKDKRPLEDSGDCKRTSIGGQALIEGLLMLGPHKQAIAVREPGGEIMPTVKERSVRSSRFNVPFCGGRSVW